MWKGSSLPLCAKFVCFVLLFALCSSKIKFFSHAPYHFVFSEIDSSRSIHNTEVTPRGHCPPRLDPRSASYEGCPSHEDLLLRRGAPGSVSRTSSSEQGDDPPLQNPPSAEVSLVSSRCRFLCLIPPFYGRNANRMLTLAKALRVLRDWNGAARESCVTKRWALVLAPAWSKWARHWFDEPVPWFEQHNFVCAESHPAEWFGHYYDQPSGTILPSNEFHQQDEPLLIKKTYQRGARRRLEAHLADTLDANPSGWRASDYDHILVTVHRRWMEGECPRRIRFDCLLSKAIGCGTVGGTSEGEDRWGGWCWSGGEVGVVVGEGSLGGWHRSTESLRAARGAQRAGGIAGRGVLGREGRWGRGQRATRSAQGVGWKWMLWNSVERCYWGRGQTSLPSPKSLC